MFGTRLYRYGSDIDSLVWLKPAEADAVNKLRLTDVGNDMYSSNLTAAEMRHYNNAAAKLNKYLETHTVTFTIEDEEAGLPILTKIL